MAQAVVLIAGFQQQHPIAQPAIAAIRPFAGYGVIHMIAPAADMIARIGQKIAAVPLDHLRALRPVPQKAGRNDLAAHIDLAGIRHFMHADALHACPIEPASAVVIHKQAAVNADAQIVADHPEGAQRAVRRQQIVPAAPGRCDHPEPARIVGHLRSIRAGGAGLHAHEAVIIKMQHILADPALDARLLAMAGAVKIKPAVMAHQEGIADLPAFPQIGERIGIAHSVGAHRHPPFLQKKRGQASRIRSLSAHQKHQRCRLMRRISSRFTLGLRSISSRPLTSWNTSVSWV